MRKCPRRGPGPVRPRPPSVTRWPVFRRRRFTAAVSLGERVPNATSIGSSPTEVHAHRRTASTRSSNRSCPSPACSTLWHLQRRLDSVHAYYSTTDVCWWPFASHVRWPHDSFGRRNNNRTPAQQITSIDVAMAYAGVKTPIATLLLVFTISSLLPRRTALARRVIAGPVLLRQLAPWLDDDRVDRGLHSGILNAGWYSAAPYTGENLYRIQPIKSTNQECPCADHQH